MNKNLHPIDETFQNAFESFSPEPPEMAWENISNALPEKRKKIAAVYWLLPLFLMVGVFGFYLGKINPFQANISSKGEKNEPQKVEKNTFVNSETQKNTTTEKNLPTNILVEKNTSAPKNTSVKNKKIVEKNLQNNLEERVVSAEKQLENTPIIVEKNYKNIEKIEDLTILKKEFKSLQSIDNQKDVNFLRGKDCFSFEKERLRSFYLEPYFGYEYVKPFFKENTGTEPSTFATVRDSSEKYRVAYSGGLRAGWILENGISIRVGAQSSHLVEKINFVLSTEKKTTTVVQEVKDAAGKVIKYDTIRTTQIGTRYKEVNNRYTTIDLPLQIGFEGNPKYHDWVFRGHAGILANLVFKKSGQIYNPNLKVDNIVDDEKIYESKLGISLTASAGFARYFGEHFSTSAEIQGVYNLKNQTVKTYSLDQKNLRLGFHLGVRYHF